MIPRRLVAALGGAASLLLAGGAAGAQSIADHDWLVLQPEVSLAYANIVAINNNALFPTANATGGWGAHVGVDAGMRFGPFTGGVRVDWARYTAYDVGGAGLFAELRAPIPFVQPFVRVGFGYAWLGHLNADPAYLACGATGTGAGCPSVSGWYGSAGGGIDFPLQRHFTLGVHADATFLNLTRGASPTSVQFVNPGDSVGLQVTVGLHAALRI